MTTTSQETAMDSKPVAEICPGWNICFIGTAPIAQIASAHGLRIGDFLYAAPPSDAAMTARIEPDEIAVNLVRLAGLDKHKARECEAIVRQILDHAAARNGAGGEA